MSIVQPGILALQGCIRHHKEHAQRLGVPLREVRTAADLESIDRIILPGGESSTMLKLLQSTELFNPLRDFVSHFPVWGVCAGAILLASDVQNPAQESLGRIPMRAERNFYGSQLHSFSDSIEFEGQVLEVDFIRAPRLTPTDASSQILSSYQGTPVCIVHGSALASSFHTELRDTPLLHEFFLNLS